MTNPRIAFQHALTVRNVVARFEEREGKIFPTPEAMNEYLKSHPSADKSKHRVETDKDKSDAKNKKDRKDWDYLRTRINPKLLEPGSDKHWDEQKEKIKGKGKKDKPEKKSEPEKKDE